MKCGSQMAVGVVGGYLLGRSHKTQLAAVLALLAAAGGECPVDARELLRRTPLGAPLDKLTADICTQLVDAGASVVKKAASSRIDSFSEKLQQRAASMRGPGVTKSGERGEAEEPLEERARGERALREPPGRERARQEVSDDYDDDIGQYESAEPEAEPDFR